MLREILTYPISPEQMKVELVFFAEHVRDLGHADCEILFGFPWGVKYYPSNRWEYERIAFESLVAKVAEVEASGIGHLGRNDLVVKIPGLEVQFRFCHDSDIHLVYESSAELAETFYQRWKSRGFQPAEWVKLPSGPPTERLRFN
jgi:hypothetical protein